MNKLYLTITLIFLSTFKLSAATASLEPKKKKTLAEILNKQQAKKKAKKLFWIQGFALLYSITSPQIW